VTIIADPPPDRELSESTWARAKRDFPKASGTVLGVLTITVLGGAGGAVVGVLGRGFNVVLMALAGTFGGALLGFVMILLVVFARTPARQRDEARLWYRKMREKLEPPEPREPLIEYGDQR
jgi:hypothetical protein